MKTKPERRPVFFCISRMGCFLFIFRKSQNLNECTITIAIIWVARIQILEKKEGKLT